LDQGIKGTGEVYEKAPNKQATQITLTGVGDFLEGYDGKVGWANDPFNGLRELAGVELADAKREADIRGDLNWKQHFTKAEVTGKEKVGESEAYVVKLTQAQGEPIVRY
jgi:hypothetical protein